MNKLLTIVIVMLLPICIFGQQKIQKQPLPLAKYDDNVKLPLTAKERSQVIEVYGDSAEKLVFNDAHRLKSIKNILRNRIEVKMITNQKDVKDCQKLSEVEVLGESTKTYVNVKTFDINNFNPLKYDFNFYARGGSMYHVDNTNYYIFVKAQNQ
ncbi:hypothetical protein [Winogradskyella sp.]|uniref:hypothetical protein n=1 Tax=Winogradskyella sp. TaxID=1883156 RepID=UPI0026059B30|nr:hypothetical protein [Winogradskyella sp.]